MLRFSLKGKKGKDPGPVVTPSSEPQPPEAAMEEVPVVPVAHPALAMSLTRISVALWTVLSAMGRALLHPFVIKVD